MNKYTITVKEEFEATYIVEAETPEKAEELFNQWADVHQEWIADDLIDNSYGWEFGKAEPVMMDCEPDITYEDLEE